MSAAGRRFAALAMAVLCHGTFGLAVGSMGLALASGLQTGLGRLPGPVGVLANLLLVAQFPLLHSFLLGSRGRPWLARLSPVGHGRTLAVSTYAWLASLQLLLTFWAWTPSGVVFGAAPWSAGPVRWLAFAAAWGFLQKALWDAGLALQTGAAGWWALWRDRPVAYPGLPTRGLFAACRQPIYLGFALVLATAPCWSLDWLLLTTGWITYCVLGPRRKERRFAALYGDRFRGYQAAVPYLLPRFR